MKSAKIYASALGVFDLFMNGSRVGQTEADGTVRYDELKPGWTDYRKEINYMTYDVTSLVREGSNVIGAQVSNGWWGGAIAHGVYGTPSLGSTSGPVIYGDIYNGETYDARRESNWSAPEYDASAWIPCMENTDFNGKITAFTGQPVRIREFLRRTPQTITEQRTGRKFVHLQFTNGRSHIKLHDERGGKRRNIPTLHDFLRIPLLRSHHFERRGNHRTDR